MIYSGNDAGFNGRYAFFERLEGWPGAVVFALFTLLTGLTAAFLGFRFAGSDTTSSHLVYPAFYPPLWLFWLVWVIIYPCWGVATWSVWRERNSADVRGAMTLYAIAIIGNVLFVPIMNLVDGMPAVLTLMDARGLVTAWLTAWLYSRYSGMALRWLTPLLLWMVLTLALKIALWVANSG